MNNPILPETSGADGPSFSLHNRVYRLLWSLAYFSCFRWTPASYFHWWRSLILRAFGAKIGRGCHVYPSATIWSPKNLTMHASSCLGRFVNCYNIAPISIGRRSTISQGAFLCTGSHDYSSEHFQLIASPINIGENVWCAADCFIGPSVVISDNAVIGARAVVFKDVGANSIVIGNPATHVKFRQISTNE